MKTVSGKVVSTKPISLSKAAKLMSRFTASDNGASPAFAAYLRRTSAAFDEVVQLHKEFKPPSAKKDLTVADETKVTAKRIKPVLVDVDETEVGLGIDGGSKNVRGTLEELREVVSVENVSDVNGALKKSNRKKGNSGDVVGNEIESGHISEEVRKDVADGGAVKSKKKKEIVEMDKLHGDPDAVNVGEEPKIKLSDVGGVEKKSKKKREKDGDVAIVDKDQAHGASIANEVEKEMGSVNASEEVKKTKKKRDKHGKENHDGVGEAVDIVQNNVDEQKKHKKKKVKDVKESNHGVIGEQKEVMEGKESCSEQRSETNAENKDGLSNEKKHKKKKKSHEPEKEENVLTIETEATDKKASRKRKHENVVDGELDGSHDAVRSKKKKVQTLE